MSAAQKTGWDEFGEYHGPFTEVTTFPCSVAAHSSCPCAAPCKKSASVCKIYPPFDPAAFERDQKGGAV
jgi:hypothetical protein